MGLDHPKIGWVFYNSILRRVILSLREEIGQVMSIIEPVKKTFRKEESHVEKSWDTHSRK